MYQKHETRTKRTIKSGGSTGMAHQRRAGMTRQQTVIDTHYEDGWYSYPIDSSKFLCDWAKKSNPNIMNWPYKSETFTNEGAKIGMFKLN